MGSSVPGADPKARLGADELFKQWTHGEAVEQGEIAGVGITQ